MSLAASTTHHCRWADCTAICTSSSDLYGHLRSTHIALGVFRCEWEQCDESLHRRRGAASHFAVHAGDAHFSCDQCSKMFRQAAHLASHNRECHTAVTAGEQPKPEAIEPPLQEGDDEALAGQSPDDDMEQDWSFALPDPPKHSSRFASPALSQLSALTEPASEHAFECRWRACESSFDSAQDLLRHVCDLHARPDAAKCEWEKCRKRNDRHLTFLQHVKKHCPVQFVCPDEACGRVMGDQSALTLHIRRHENENESKKRVHQDKLDTPRKKYKNDRDAGAPSSLLSIKQQPASPAMPTHRCLWTDCTIICTSAKLLFEHLQEAHITHSKVACKWQLCNMMLNFRNVILHLSEHAAYKPFPCNSCSNAFSSASTLSQHRRHHCEGLPAASPDTASEPERGEAENIWTVRHLCKWRACTAMFDSEKDLLDHLCGVHARPGVSYCAWNGCSDQSRAFIRLAKHARIHVPIALPCHSCDKNFTSQTDLTRHLHVDHDQLEAASTDGSTVQHPQDDNDDDLSLDHYPTTPRSPSSALSELTALPEPMEFPCRWTGCPASFDTANSLLQHLSNAHTRKDYGHSARTCAWAACTRSIVGRQNFNRHIRSHLTYERTGDESTLTNCIREEHEIPEKRSRITLQDDDEVQTPPRKKIRMGNASESHQESSERASSDTALDSVETPSVSRAAQIVLSRAGQRSVIEVEDVIGGMEDRMRQHLDAEIERRVTDAVQRALAMQDAIGGPRADSIVSPAVPTASLFDWSERYIEEYNNLVDL